MNKDDDINIIDFPTRPEDAAPKHPPLINLPPLTKYFALLLLVIHAALQYVASPEQQYWIYENLGFVPARYTNYEALTATAFAAPLTYMLLHGNWAHVLTNTAMLAAFGAGVERWMGPAKTAGFFILCGLASIFVQFCLDPSATVPVIGASGGLSGLFAAVLVMMQRSGIGSTGRFGLWPLIILWIVVSAVFGMTGGPDGSTVAWAAHIGGFAAGFLLLPLFNRTR